jgi:hypothetical protein
MDSSRSIPEPGQIPALQPREITHFEHLAPQVDCDIYLAALPADKTIDEGMFHLIIKWLQFVDTLQVSLNVPEDPLALTLIGSHHTASSAYWTTYTTVSVMSKISPIKSECSPRSPKPDCHHEPWTIWV